MKLEKKLVFIFNPKAGKGKIKTSLMEIVDIFNKCGYEVIIRATQAPRDAYEQVKKYADQVDLIVCSGGDGTLDEVVTGITEVGSNVPIGYIPAGSTNDFANSLFMPKNMLDAASMIMDGEIYKCDVGRFNHQTFAYVAAFGLFTDVSYETSQDLKNILGHLAYVLEGAKRLLDIKSYHMKVVTESGVIEDNFIYGMVTNSRSVGGFKNLTKDVDMNDGLFEVTLIVQPKNPLEMQEIIRNLLSMEDNSDLIYSFKARKLTIEADEAVAWTLDGEYGGSPEVVEIENHRARMYSGNYSAFAEKKAQIRDAELKAWMNQQQEIRHQEAVIEKLRSFNREKSIRRAESREKMLQKIEVLDKPVETRADMRMELHPRIMSGNDVLDVENLAKAFGPERLFEGLSFSIKRGEHVAVIGDNGTGKTTILKIINGLVEQDAGNIRLGTKVHIGYYDQEHHVLHPDKTLFEEISDEYPALTNTEIRNVLAAFLFTGDDVFKQIKMLSGGERGRVSLAKLMLSEANFLILDEPTNHLDIMSKEILEDAINSYSGTVLYVSHDRYFINRTASRILELCNGGFTGYLGNYDYYLEKKAENTVLSSGTGGAFPPAAGGIKSEASSAASSSLKQDWQSQKEAQAALRKKENALKRCEEQIERLETRSQEIDAEMLRPEVCTDVTRLQALAKEKEQVEEELLLKMEEWESLSD